MSSPPTDLLIVMGANLLKKKYPGLVQPNLKLADFLKNFKLFFHTAWQTYMNICLCVGCTDTRHIPSLMLWSMSPNFLLKLKPTS